jgi:hypothetical protein
VNGQTKAQQFALAVATAINEQFQTLWYAVQKEVMPDAKRCALSCYCRECDAHTCIAYWQLQFVAKLAAFTIPRPTAVITGFYLLHINQ